MKNKKLYKIGNKKRLLDKKEKLLTKGNQNHFTDKEKEVLNLLAEGKPCKEISSVLKINIRTAESHIRNIHLKTNTHSLIELGILAYKNGY